MILFILFLIKLINTMSIDYESINYDITSGIPLFDKVFENITVKIGQQATLPCFINNLGTYKVIWTKSGDILTLGNVKINTDSRLNVQHRYVSEWNLIIDNVVTDDEGEYYCKTNGNYFKIVNLQVLVPSSIDDLRSTPAGVITLKEGSSLSLKCFADGKPIPQVKWYRWKKYKNSISDKIELSESGNEIYISSINKNDENIYECIAKNSVPPATSRIFNIDVQFLPNIDLNIRKTYQFLNKKVSFECKIQANPLDKSYWLKNGHAVHSHHNSNIKIDNYDVNELYTSVSLLTIQSIGDGDFGEYQCCAENSFGTTCSNVYLQEIIDSQEKSSSIKYLRPTTQRISSTLEFITIDDDSISNVIYEDQIEHKTSYELTNKNANSNFVDPKDKRRHNLIKAKDFIQVESKPISSHSFKIHSQFSFIAIIWILVNI